MTGEAPLPRADADAALPRVVFVDDDPAIRRFVAMALQDLPVAAVACADAAAARAALREAPAVLLLTDLMMPGESGLDLLRSLAADPVLRGPARLAVFSAGLRAEGRHALEGLDLWRELVKPVGLQALQDCVLEAVAAARSGAVAVPGHAPPGAPAPAQGGAAPAAAQDPTRAAIDQLFGGDAALYAAFRLQALAQFGADRVALRAAVAAADWPAVRRQAHSLKGVFATLGDAPGSALARGLEDAAQAGDGPACATAWPSLDRHLAQLHAPAGP